MATNENMKKWEAAHKKLAEAHKKREAERGTSKTTNPLMKDFKERMEKRENEKAKKDLESQKAAADKAGRKYSLAEDKPKHVAPNGKEYAGPGGGPNSGGGSKSKAAPSTPSKPATPRRRRATGRSEMMSQRQRSVMEREEEKRKQAQEKGGSNVVGS